MSETLFKAQYLFDQALVEHYSTDVKDLTVSSVTDVHSDVARRISGHSQSVLEEAISNFQFTFNSPSVTALGCLPPIATFSHQAPQRIKKRTNFEFRTGKTHIPAQVPQRIKRRTRCEDRSRKAHITAEAPQRIKKRRNCEGWTRKAHIPAQAPQRTQRRTSCENGSRTPHIRAQDLRKETFSRALSPKGGLPPAKATSRRSDKSLKVKKQYFTCTHPTCPRSRPENAFRRHYQLVLHLRIHSEEKPFACNRCQQRFSSRENLRRHQSHHLGVKSYTCPECQKSFFRTSDRSNCLRLHRLEQKLLTSDEATKGVNAPAAPAPVPVPAPPAPMPVEQQKPVEFVCPVCTIPRAYRNGGALRKHLRYHHPDFKRPSIINLPKHPVDRRKKATATGKQPPPSTVGVHGPGSKDVPPKDSDVFIQSNCPSMHQPVVSEVSSPPTESRHLTQGPTSWIAVYDGMLTQPVYDVLLLQDNGVLCETTECQIPATDFETGIPISMEVAGSFMPHPAAQQQEIHREARTDLFVADIMGGLVPRDAHLREVIYSTGDDFYQQSALMLQDSPRLLQESEENSKLCTPILPVDLCTSALCLTTDDAPHPYPMQYEQEPFAALSRSEDEALLGESVAHLKSTNFQAMHRPPSESSFVRLQNSAAPFSTATTTTEEEMPLDLTEMQSDGVFSHPSSSEDFFPFRVDEVIDLSAASTFDRSCPMDLSSQNQAPGVSNGVHDIVGAWDPEPGFSFTDLLTDEDSTTHEFLRGFYA